MSTYGQLDFLGFLVRQGSLSADQAGELRRTLELGSAPIGRLLMLLGFIDAKDVVHILELKRQSPGLRFGELAVREGLVTKEQLAVALKRQWKAPRSQAELVRESKLLDDDVWARAMIDYVGFLEDAIHATKAA
ncbi:hypothetical protein L6R52_20115 [Myxococcota bacterium]|nr:hypothetical protein [Myxococcota bacterium]